MGQGSSRHTVIDSVRPVAEGTASFLGSIILFNFSDPSGSAKSAEDRGILTGVAQVSKGKWEVLQAQVTYIVKPDGDPHRHLDLPLQAPAAKAKGGAVGGGRVRSEL